MNQFQKNIKYLAMALAIFLTVSIIYSMIAILAFATSIFGLNDFLGSVNDNEKIDYTSEDSFTQSYDNIDRINISHGAGKLIVKSSDDTDKVLVSLSNNKDEYKVSTSKGTLRLENKSKINNIFSFGGKKKHGVDLTISLPKNYNLEELEIDAGAGKIDLEGFNTDKLYINAGAGDITVTKVQASDIELDGGIGQTTFKDVLFNKGDIDTGVGNINFTGKLIGRHKINSGIGEVNLNLKGKLQDYDLKIDKGLGEIRINGQKFKNVDLRQLNTDNEIDINGGIGSININFTE